MAVVRRAIQLAGLRFALFKRNNCSPAQSAASLAETSNTQSGFSACRQKASQATEGVEGLKKYGGRQPPNTKAHRETGLQNDSPEKDRKGTHTSDQWGPGFNHGPIAKVGRAVTCQRPRSASASGACRRGGLRSTRPHPFARGPRWRHQSTTKRRDDRFSLAAELASVVARAFVQSLGGVVRRSP